MQGISPKPVEYTISRKSGGIILRIKDRFEWTIEIIEWSYKEINDQQIINIYYSSI